MDPFLSNFLKKYKLNTQKDVFEWTTFHVESRIEDIMKKMEEYKLLLSTIEQSKKNDTDFETKLSSLQAEIQELMQVFQEGNPQFALFLQRNKKTERHKRWKRKKKAKLVSKKEEEQELFEIMDKVIDEWMAARVSEHKKQVREEEKRRLEANLIHQQKLLRKRNERKVPVLIKLEQLRQVRRNNAMFLSDDQQAEASNMTLADIVRQVKEQKTYINVPSLIPYDKEDNNEPISDEKDNTAMEVTIKTEPIDNDSDIMEQKMWDELEAENTEQPARRQTTSDGTSKAQQMEEAIFNFYHQAEQSLENLIMMRRHWDGFLVPPGTGSRVPQHKVYPTPPSSKKWKKYLVQ